MSWKKWEKRKKKGIKKRIISMTKREKERGKMGL